MAEPSPVLSAPILEIIDKLRDLNPDALLAAGLEDALVGVGYRCGQPALAIYSIDKAVQVLVKRDGMDEEGARECLEFNSIGAWMGEHTPIWMY